MKFSTGITAAAMAGAVAAQISGISQQCTVQLGLLAVGDLGQCLALQQLIPLVVGQNSGSVVEPLDNYLSSLCSNSTAKCSNATLTSAQSTVESACASDISSVSGGNNGTAIDVLNGVFESYPQFYTAACSRNETTNTYCVTSILEQLQNATGQDLNFGSVSTLLSGGSDGLSQLNSALGDGQLCTGCVAGIYRQAIAANASITNIPAISSIASRCGSGFGTTASETGVSSVGPSGSASSGSGGASGSASSRAATSTGNAGYVMAPAAFSTQSILGVGALVGGLLAGAAAVL